MNVSRETLTPQHFFDLGDLWFAELMNSVQHPWELLAPKYKEEWMLSRMRSNVFTLPREGSFVLKTTKLLGHGGEAIVQAGSYIEGDEIELQGGVVIEAGAYVTGPTILGSGTVVRHGAYVRGGVITGKKAVIGHTSELKSSILLNEAKAAHFAYVGDSILGNHVNLGAGTKISNLKITGDAITLRVGTESIPTGLRKMGAIMGDHVETGCNSVLNPGVLLAPKCMVYPAIAVKNLYYSEKTVIKK